MSGNAPCGTRQGYRRHLRRGEQTCPSCRSAERAYQRARYARRGTDTSRPLHPCGTPAAARRHQRNGDPPCPACSLKYPPGAARATPGPECGTTAAHSRHRARRERPCRPCQDAANAAARARRRTQHCGTLAGHDRHLKDHTPPCPPCLSAHALLRRSLYTPTHHARTRHGHARLLHTQADQDASRGPRHQSAASCPE